MVAEIQREILFSKVSIFFLFSYTIFVVYFFCVNRWIQLNIRYLSSYESLFRVLNFSISLDYFNLVFIIIVMPVTIFVLKYREFYVEHYNNKKFYFLLFIFFLSILILITSRSSLNLIIGWDRLGLSSICLIIFYPNKTSLYNSIITIFFNRLGDVIIILGISFLISNYREDLTYSLNNIYILTIFILCAYRKSAQFPLSRWLPAAISAPTPISAMVHSSTLVTAGIFLLDKYYFFYIFNHIRWIPLFFRSLTFFLGGIIANLEKDFKKIVAFSTIRQIRIIIFLCYSLTIWISLAHIFLHAFFKTLLFCCCGILFTHKIDTQIKKNLRINISTKPLEFYFFLSIFNITGLIFSSSFFRKDLSLELIIDQKENLNFFILLACRILTLLYCSILLKRSIRWNNLINYLNAKKNNEFNIILFRTITVTIWLVIKNFIKFETFPILNDIELIIILVIFIYTFFIKILNCKLILNFTINISIIKIYSYSFIRLFLKRKIIKHLRFRDLIIFKPKIFKIKFNNFKFKNIKVHYIILLLLIIIKF